MRDATRLDAARGPRVHGFPARRTGVTAPPLPLREPQPTRQRALVLVWTSWGTTPRSRRASPRHVSGSLARYWRPPQLRPPRCVRSVHLDGARNGRVGRFPKGRGGEDPRRSPRSASDAAATRPHRQRPRRGRRRWPQCHASDSPARLLAGASQAICKRSRGPTVDAASHPRSCHRVTAQQCALTDAPLLPDLRP